MMTISAGLQAALNSGSTFIATCASVALKNGTVIYFTDHEVNLTVGGNTYLASNSFMVVTPIRTDATSDAGDFEIDTDTGSITEADVDAGLYDGATFSWFQTDYSNLANGTVALPGGYVGTITTIDGKHTIQVTGKKRLMNQNVVRIVAKTCDAILGDSRCTVNLAGTDSITGLGYRLNKTVSAVTDTFTLSLGSTTLATGYYDQGKLTFTSGLNNGISREIKTHTNSSGTAVIVLHEEFPYAVSVSDAVTIEVGCDHQYATCRDKFLNQLNFRGQNDRKLNLDMTTYGTG